MASVKNFLVGVVLVVFSIWWVFKGSASVPEGVLPFYPRDGLSDLIVVINGGLPVLIFLFGILILWIELEDFKIERELKKKPKKRKK